MQIFFCTHNRGALLDQTLMRSHKNTGLPLCGFYVKRSSPQLDYVKKCKDITTIIVPKYYSQIQIWNLFLLLSDKPLVIHNGDDVILQPLFVKKLEQAEKENIDVVEFKAWCSFGLHQRLISKIGWHDERYLTLYYEDYDLFFRLKEHQANGGKIKWTQYTSSNCVLDLNPSYGGPGRKAIPAYKVDRSFVLDSGHSLAYNQEIAHMKWGANMDKPIRQLDELRLHPFDLLEQPYEQRLKYAKLHYPWLNTELFKK